MRNNNNDSAQRIPEQCVTFRMYWCVKNPEPIHSSSVGTNVFFHMKNTGSWTEQVIEAAKQDGPAVLQFVINFKEKMELFL